MSDQVLLPSADALDACLDLLGKLPNEPVTLQLHDPIYLMRRDSDPLQLPLLRVALDTHQDHALARQVSALLEAWMPRIEDDLESVLGRDGPIPDGVDPLRELARRLEESKGVRAMLEDRIEDLEGRTRRWMQTSNVLASAGALIAIIGVVGWLVALGALSIPWVESPTVDTEELEAIE